MRLLLYVDNIVLARFISLLLSSFKFTLAHEFEIKDLGALYYFMGIEGSSLSNGLHLS